MSRNIKEIGKELLGKSLNSFHRKTGLTQLEKNNEMQNGILNGILSQVDDAYIEKTEQSNVIHLEGSGDGVVVLDGIEGNTLVNLLNFNDIKRASNYNCLNIDLDKKSLSINTGLEFDNRYQYFRIPNITLYSNKEYTFVCNITKNTFSKTFEIVPYSSRHSNRKGTNGDGSHYLKVGQTGIHKYTFTMVENDIFNIMYADSNAHFNSGEVEIINPMILKGDWSDKEIPASYFEGLQSSFEEKVNDEGKYEIEILSVGKNILDNPFKDSDFIRKNSDGTFEIIKVITGGHIFFKLNVSSPHICYSNNNCVHLLNPGDTFMNNVIINGEVQGYIQGNTPVGTKFKMQVEKLKPNQTSPTNYEPYKQNKIKLLINEPLRGIGNTKDRLCVKDNKLMVERNIYGFTHTPTKTTIENINTQLINDGKYRCKPNNTWNTISGHLICDKNREIQEYHLCANTPNTIYIEHKAANNPYLICINSSDLLDRKICYILETPYYEEVLNEYGEPILLEGYENGTIYIDSTIVPTTTVRYTQKMESFKTLKEVNNNNIMLTNDVNDNIIPYMMDVDLMIMEKEMALMSHKNIRTIGVKDMTSMQKRTQDMLERLIKGKTLTEQECKTRVTTYLNAGKITDAQAEELMLLIDEVYA